MEKPQDVRLRSLIAQLAVAASHRRPPARPRVYRPGPRALAAMNTRQLIHETITTYRFREEPRFSSLSDELTDRGLRLTAHLVGLGLGAEALESFSHFTTDVPAEVASSSPQDINAGINELFSQSDLKDLDADRPGLTTMTTMEDLIDQNADEDLVAAFDDVADFLVPDLAAALEAQMAAPAREPEAVEMIAEAQNTLEL